MDRKAEYKKSFRSFAESAFIVPKCGGNPVPFKPNKIQDSHIKNWHYRSIVVKARQCGFTTLKKIELLFFAKIIPNGELVLVFQDEDIGKEKLQSLKEQILAFKPEIGISIDPTCNNLSAFRLLPSRSMIRISTGSGFDPARSTTKQMVLGSEFAYWRRAQKSMESVEETVPTDGVLCFESTPEGEDNLFCVKYRENVGKPIDSNLQYKTYFYPWFWCEDYKEDPPKNMELTKEEVELIEKYNLTFGQIFWRRKKMGEPTIQNIIKFNKLYPSDDVSCWGAATLGSKFNTNRLMEMPVQKFLYEDRRVRVYKECNSLDRYYMGVDGAKGANDDNAFVIIDKNMEIVAAFNSNEISCTTFAKLALEYAKKYNAYVEIEGDSWGYHIAYLFEENKYFNFILQVVDEKNKAFLIAKISDWVELTKSYIDSELRTRLMLFTGDRKKGDRDDICMAFGHALMAIGEKNVESYKPLITTTTVDGYYNEIDKRFDSQAPRW